jgi:4-hydroxy-3-methylbut-2-enyl diphosphate reductase IspH
LSSNSDRLERISHELGSLASDIPQQQDVEAAGPPRETVERIFCAGVRLLASQPEPSEQTLLKDLSPTEACTAAAALLRAQGLTPFEFGVWFSASGPRDIAQ